jgi:hypothetical protein
MLHATHPLAPVRSLPHLFPRVSTRGSKAAGALSALVATAATAFVACSGGAPGPSVVAASNPALVTLDLRDGGNAHIGSCSGVLVSGSTVLTAGHCLVASSKVIVTKADGQAVTGSHFWTTWKNFDSTLSHPAHSDVGVVLLDRPMFASSYPVLASAMVSDGATLARVRRIDALSVDPTQFDQVIEPVRLGAAMGFPLSYTMDPGGFEGETDTGGPLFDPNTNTLYGVVSGRGMVTREFYVARVEYLADWISQIAQCAPPPIEEQCHRADAGVGSSGGWPNGSSGGSGGSGGSSGGSGWSSGSSGSGSGGRGPSSSSGSSSGSGDDGGVCTPPPPPPPPPMTPDDSGASGSGSGGASSSGSGGGEPTPPPDVPFVPDGPGCYDASCGGCGVDPACQDGQMDYGDCGCAPSSYEAGPIQ